jgi:hypothetical protein
VQRHVVDGVHVADEPVDQQALPDREVLLEVLDGEQDGTLAALRFDGRALGRRAHSVTPPATNPIWPSA